MGKIDRKKLFEILEKNNPRRGKEDISKYLDCYTDYVEAQNSIAEKGTIVAHPKTGAPIENPYLKIRQEMSAALGRIGLKADDLWEE